MFAEQNTQPFVSVHLKVTIYGCVEVIGRKKADSAGDQEETQGEKCHVPEVNHYRNEAVQVELGDVVPSGVYHHVHSTRARCEEGSPPPSIIFIAEVNVA